jgi:two-component system OmpR family response regulator
MRITIIEDNQTLADAIAHRLADQGHAVTKIYDGVTGAKFLHDDNADLVILDINLPRKDGLQILSELRSREDMTPVILLTARTLTSDMIEGLDLGADDYLTKPFELDVLEARIRALLRRQSTRKISKDTLADLTFDYGARRLFAGKTTVELPRRELALFECLIMRKNQIVSKAAIVDHIFGLDSDVNETAIETYVSRLRKQLKPYQVTIKSARGLGYMLTEMT